MHDLPELTRSELAARLNGLRRAQRRQPMPEWAARAQRLQTLRRLIVEHRAELIDAINQDFGQRPAQETELLELVPTLAGIEHALKCGQRWMKPRRRAVGWRLWPARGWQMPQPRGVVGIVVPWNYPLFLSLGPLTGALAAGNRAMIKLSESSPAFFRVMQRLVGDYFAPDEVVVLGGNVDEARAFVSLPFDQLVFTGSTAVGRSVMQAAAANLTPVTLELGGKSPALITEDCDFEQAVSRILYGKLVNAGQTCVAPDYVLLPAGREADFIAVAKRWAERLYPAWPRDFASMATAGQFQRMQAVHDDALTLGALAHGLLPAATLDAQARFFPPFVYTGVPTDARLLSEELFGPLLPLVPYQTLEEALAWINDRPHPLALYVFTRSRAKVRRVLQQTRAGGVTVNDTLLHIAAAELPFGGVGESGMGAYHGKDGFDGMSHLKSVLRQGPIRTLDWLMPPYGEQFARLVKWLTR
ncbi:coniferyl-aldehyde dehydrogenase [Silvimonas terrae]|uniref:Aldehyde dehydrogenase n=1 Tax=Silvimonas terrae TaxID=300266 RepID=A0A840RLK4_9NEIS|nr:coniferyl aldehyde dehydrogenase [Silvimonas terrae]MBB5193156.1 coniferyl-aldehyde dehydrogenase [Silvimonas terrae]